MARLFADENFPHPTVELLRKLGHEVVTAVQAGIANKGIPDEIVLEYATRLGHAVITHNWDDFASLHDRRTAHAGIVICVVDPDAGALVERIDRAIVATGELAGKLIRVT
jgi:predicted nuclease of predicted toxin-antitoxin system